MTRVVLIIGGSSDIGLDLVDRYLTAGHKVIATYRNPAHFEVKSNPNIKNIIRYPLNVSNYIQRYNLYDYLKKKELFWDTIIFLNATVLPIGPFMDVDINRWDQSITDNAISPSRLLQLFYKIRNKDGVSNVCFFSGGGVNGVLDNYSNYTISKIILHKLVELLNSEHEDLNPFIIGPSFTKTKIHEQSRPHADLAGDSWKKTLDLLNNDKGTPLVDIYDCIEWCCSSGKKVVGGRNISVRYDPWKGEGEEKFVRRLKRNKDLLKLRRKI